MVEQHTMFHDATKFKNNEWLAVLLIYFATSLSNTAHKVSQVPIKCHNFLNFVLRIFPVQKGFLGIQGACLTRTECLFPSISLFLCKTQTGACSELEIGFSHDAPDSTIFRCPCCPRR